jgi:hypothetical protein
LSAFGHTAPQAPQLPGLVARSTHRAARTHQVNPGGQATVWNAHRPCSQATYDPSGGLGHRTPQSPQLAGSMPVTTGVHIPLQILFGAGHIGRPMHVPQRQISPAAQGWPHVPQFMGSDARAASQPFCGFPSPLAMGLPLQIPMQHLIAELRWGGPEPVEVPPEGLSGNLVEQQASGVLAQWPVPPGNDGHFVVFKVEKASAQATGFLRNLADNPAGRVPAP